MAILGIDEVGRGPLAGPLVVGAVVLPEVLPEWVLELRDSKKLSASKREKLSELILAEATTGLGWVFPEELDLVGVSEALRLATRRAVLEIQGQKVKFSEIVIDGKVNFLAGTKLERFVTTVVKADDLIREVSAASIIAKVARDRYMMEADLRYPGYGFAKNVGYGTKKHIEAISSIGLSPEHRRSYEPCKSISGFSREEVSKKNTTEIGSRGEEAVCRFLEWKGHRILERNFRTRFSEIDIVSIFQDQIYFTEVKYRERADYGGGFAAITKEKQRRMRRAAEGFLKIRAEYQKYDPLLTAAAVSGADFIVEDFIIIR